MSFRYSIRTDAIEDDEFVEQADKAGLYEQRDRELEDYLSNLSVRHGYVVTRSTDQSIPDDTTTNISWDTEVSDTDRYITPTTDTATIPFRLDGLYTIIFSLTGVDAGGSRSIATILAGGVTYVQPIAAYDTTQTFALGAIPLDAGDTIVCKYRHTTGAANSVQARCEVFKVGA